MHPISRIQASCFIEVGNTPYAPDSPKTLKRVVLKIMAPFWGTLNIKCRLIIRTPQRDHNFDNHPNPNPHKSEPLSALLHRSRRLRAGVPPAGRTSAVAPSSSEPRLSG